MRLLGSLKVRPVDLARVASDYKVNCLIVNSSWKRLLASPLPAIAFLRDNGVLVLCKLQNDSVLALYPESGVMRTLSRADFLADWGGHVMLARPMGPIQSEAERFGINWFFKALRKYAPIVLEVIVASLVLQLLGLISPLVFEAVVDKVLVNHTIGTLNVLVSILALAAAFEFSLGGIRTYVFSHTTSRLDIELGMRLFQHLIDLPLSYFLSRRVGVSVSRVRELDNVRSFLTSSAVTLVVDALFTLLYLGIMASYSLPLTTVVVISFPLYIALSKLLIPLFQERIQEKFRAGAENQSFLVEAISGIETIKALSAERQIQRRWEDGLARYVAVAFRASNVGN